MDIIFRFRPVWEPSMFGTASFLGVTVNSSIVCYLWVKHCLQDHAMKTYSTPKVPESIPKVLQNCQKSTSKVLQQCSKSTPKVPRKYSKSTPKVLQKYSKSAPKVLHGVPQQCPKSTPKVL